MSAFSSVSSSAISLVVSSMATPAASPAVSSIPPPRMSTQTPPAAGAGNGIAAITIIDLATNKGSDDIETKLKNLSLSSGLTYHKYVDTLTLTAGCKVRPHPFVVSPLNGVLEAARYTQDSVITFTCVLEPKRTAMGNIYQLNEYRALLPMSFVIKFRMGSVATIIAGTTDVTKMIETPMVFLTSGEENPDAKISYTRSAIEGGGETASDALYKWEVERSTVNAHITKNYDLSELCTMGRSYALRIPMTSAIDSVAVDYMIPRTLVDDELFKQMSTSDFSADEIRKILCSPAEGRSYAIARGNFGLLRHLTTTMGGECNLMNLMNAISNRQVEICEYIATRWPGLINRNVLQHAMQTGSLRIVLLITRHTPESIMKQMD